ncbi:hypothetical protein [Methylomonas methanica]|uniref:Ferric oxidoreductase domain-containing protein n=1 Tax=Methylomonas methanica (strain DSM 25384 / MC09) TaxID=857087 RepID=G0A193_METMM|nr:hypothetical protein [Methylomonas methanica]AEG02513.1 hypothetical protein Metme_4162 [Methylomonas methanica MC09]
MVNFSKSEWLLALLFLVPGWVFLKTEGDLSVYFFYQVPDGQFLYLLSKLCGLFAFVFFGLQLLLGLLSSCGYQLVNKSSHRKLGLWVLVLLISHGGLFVTAASLRNQHFAYKFLLPNFFESYYPAMVSLGLLAACLVIVGVLSAIFVRHNDGVWIWMHRLAWPAFFLAWFHSYSIGSETRIAPMPFVFGLLLASIVLAICYRVWLGFSNRGAISEHLKRSGR